MDLMEYVTHECGSLSDTISESENNACFDCNICLEFARDPVVTLCGHLYYWPCIYKWFHVQSASLASDERPQCPVCKADVSHTTVVPLYGRGQTQSETEHQTGSKSPYQSTPIPHNPWSSSSGTIVHLLHMLKIKIQEASRDDMVTPFSRDLKNSV